MPQKNMIRNIDTDFIKKRLEELGPCTGPSWLMAGLGFKSDNLANIRRNGLDSAKLPRLAELLGIEENDPRLFKEGAPSTDDTLATVETDTDNIMLFGSRPPFVPEYPKTWREPFAFKVVDQFGFKAAIRKTKTWHEQGRFKRHPIAWQLWKVIRRTPIDRAPRGYTVINDYTCDIDKPEDVKHD